MFRLPPLTPFTKKVLITLLATFVAVVVVERLVGINAFHALALSPAIGIHSLWQVFTFVFVTDVSPNGVLWLLFGLFFLWLMTVPFEQRFGPKATMQLFVVCTVAAGVATLVAAQILPSAVPAAAGVSPLFMGLIAAFGIAVPSSATVSLYGVLPMKPRTMIWAFLGLSALIHLAGGHYAGFVGDLAAVGAAIAFIRWLGRPRRQGPRRRRNGGGSGRFEVVPGGRNEKRPRYLN